jgi:WD40 repeat protein
MVRRFLFTSLLALLCLVVFPLRAEEPVPQVTIEGIAGWAHSLEFSPDGKLLACGSGDTTITLWDVGTAKKLRTLTGHTSTVGTLAFSSDGKQLASGEWDGTVRVWDVASGKVVEEFKLPGKLDYNGRIDYRVNGVLMAAFLEDKSIRLWNGDGDSTVLKQDRKVDGFAFNADGTMVATGDSSGGVNLWDSATGKQIDSFSDDLTHAGSICSFAFSADGKWLAIGDSYPAVQLCSQKGIRIAEFDYGDEGLESIDYLAFNPQSTLLAVAIGHAPDVYLWSPKSHKRVVVLPCEIPRSIGFSPDGRFLASGHMNSIKLWDLQGVKIEP